MFIKGVKGHYRNSPMKCKLTLIIVVIATLLLNGLRAAAQEPDGASATLGTAFTYQGRLTDAGGPINGLCDLQFSLWDALAGAAGQPLGPTQTVAKVAISDGLFTVVLDFGDKVFTGPARWLEVEVRCPAGNGDFTPLTPRQPLTPVPYALYAQNGSLDGKDTAYWQLGGNAGLASDKAILGTTNNLNLTLSVSNTVALRLLPSRGIPNIIAGSKDNSVSSDVEGATIGGGGSPNSSANSVLSSYGVVAGGFANHAGKLLLHADYATVSGGWYNTASGKGAVVPGGMSNVAEGDYSFAAGYQAVAKHAHTFVWSGDGTSGITSTGEKQFIVHAPGGVWFGKWSRSPDLASPDIFINTSTGAYLSSGGTWTNGSDRAAKENFSPVDVQDILSRVAEIPLTSWNYKAEDPATRHLGPMAQDFYAAFGLGQDDKHISTVDGNGVALAAIQALYQHTQAVETENKVLRQQVDNLEARLAALEQASAGRPVNPAAGILWPGAGLLLAGLGLVWLRQRPHFSKLSKRLFRRGEP
jgi:hypothetical protein